MVTRKQAGEWRRLLQSHAFGDTPFTFLPGYIADKVDRNRKTLFDVANRAAGVLCIRRLARSQCEALHAKQFLA
ncbi:MAG: hypothetical protein ACREV9_01910 [Burkholderiales bacterium]